MYADSTVTPQVETPVEQVIPFFAPRTGRCRGILRISGCPSAPARCGAIATAKRGSAGGGPSIADRRRAGAAPSSFARGQKSGPGHWRRTSEGGYYWTLTIESPGAKALRVHLENLVIPAGGHVMIYNTSNPDEIYGPYRQRDLYGYSDLWTASVFGSVVTLEYYVPPDVSPAPGAGFQVTEISHVYVDGGMLLGPREGWCHNDVTCHSAWGPEADGVAGLGTISGTVALWCSGGLLNDFDGDTYVGYFLTANHCLSGNGSDWVRRPRPTRSSTTGSIRHLPATVLRPFWLTYRALPPVLT